MRQALGFILSLFIHAGLIAIALIAILKTWIVDVVLESRKKGSTPKKELWRLYNMGQGLPLDAIKKELELPSDLSKQRTIKLALERCGLTPAATIAEDVVNVANFLEIATPTAASDV